MEVFTYDNNKDIRKYAEENNLNVEHLKKIFFTCQYYETRNSWGHKGYFRIGLGQTNARIRYYNRTWEEYTYQSLLFHLLDKYKEFCKKNGVI